MPTRTAIEVDISRKTLAAFLPPPIGIAQSILRLVQQRLAIPLLILIKHTINSFKPRSPAQRRRRQMLVRLAIGAAFSLLVLFVFMPSVRSTIFGILSLGLFSGAEELQLETVRYYDLSNSGGTARGWEREERVLMCAPLRDAESHLPMFFSHLHNFTYPHHLIDLAFLVSDSKDNTLGMLSQMLKDLQNHPDPKQPYGEISVIEKDFGQKVEQDVESRHGFAAQASRRKLMAQARNWLLSAALRPSHSWVYWRDADVETAPFTILEDLMRHNKDVIVPNVWRPLPDWLGGEQPYDLNSWQESETALALADTLDEDAVIVEGYAEYATWRPHLAYLRDPYGDPDMEMEIDGVGGVSILAKAKVFRSGVHFPAFSFEKHAETEGFGKMAKRMQFSVVGLPHYTVWHLYEPSVDDIRHMEEMEQERRNQENEEKERTERAKKIKEEFSDKGADWETDKNTMDELTHKEEQIKKEHEGAMAAGKKDLADEKASKAEDEEPAKLKGAKNPKDDKETKATSEVKDEKEAKVPKEMKEDKEAKVSKESKDDDEPKFSKDSKEDKEMKVLKEKDDKGVKESKESKGDKDIKAVNEPKDDEDAKVAKEPKDDTAVKALKVSKSDEESVAVKDSEAERKTKTTKDNKVVTDKETKSGKNTKDPEDAKAEKAS